MSGKGTPRANRRLSVGLLQDVPPRRRARCDDRAGVSIATVQTGAGVIEA